MSDNYRYTYRAEWSPEDDEYVGLVAEFPGLSWLAPTAGEAIAGAERLIDDILADMKETGEIPPVPLAERRYSGNISFRTSPDHHRRLAIEAAEQGVSINQWMVQRLSAVARTASWNAGQLEELIGSAVEKACAKALKPAQAGIDKKHFTLVNGVSVSVDPASLNQFGGVLSSKELSGLVGESVPHKMFVGGHMLSSDDVEAMNSDKFAVVVYRADGVVDSQLESLKGHQRSGKK